MLRLSDVAERFGLSGTGANRAALRRLRTLEQSSGRTIVVRAGERGRHMVLESELDAAMEGSFGRHVDALAERIRQRQQQIEESIRAISERLARVERERSELTRTDL